MIWKTYTTASHGIVWLIPTICVSTGATYEGKKVFQKKMFDIAFHWITFGFGLSIEWGRI